MSFRLPALAAVVLLTGAAPPGPLPPEVRVARPFTREVTDYADFTGRAEPSATVQLKPRVSGYLSEAPFKEGAEVKKGDVLFQIDLRPYKAELDKAAAVVAVAQAVLAKAEADLKRGKALHDRKAVSVAEFEALLAAREEAVARLRAAKAARDLAAVNLAYTQVTAPMDGRVGRRLVDPGNLVKADETTLATLVARGPMHVHLDIDEVTLLRLRRAGVKSARAAVGLADEEGFPHRAEAGGLDGPLDPKTGTLRLRAVLADEKGLMVPGLFVRVRLTVGKPHKALLVPERAVERNLNRIGRINGLTPGGYVLVVEGEGRVAVREVRLGQRHGDLVVIEGGLKAEDWVVLDGPGAAKEGTLVRPKRAATPAREK
jgi:RND family efflux transporter MFP subunit